MISVISSQTITANGNLTVPSGCSLIVALIKGSTDAPLLGGVSMLSLASIGATGKSQAVSIHQFEKPSAGTIACTMNGISGTFVYLSGAETYREGALFGHNDLGSFSGDLATDPSDIVLGILTGMIGATTLKGDGSEFSYLVNTATEKVGYITPADSLLSCLATDDGVSTGYWIDGGIIHHDRVLISEAYIDHPPVLHTVTWQYDHHDTPWLNDWYRKYDNGVYIGTYKFPKSEGVPSTTYYYDYPRVEHPEVWQEAYDEELPDIWVEGGEHAQVSACFVSIKSTASDDEFVGYTLVL